MQELSNIHELYKKMKTSVFTSSEQAASSLNLVRNDPVPELRGAVMDFHKWQNRTVRLFFFFCCCWTSFLPLA